MSTTRLDHRSGILRSLTDDRGAVTLQNVIIAPLLLTMFAVFLHFGILLHANNLAQAAATSAYNAARNYNASSSDGTTAGLAILSQSGSPIDAASVAVDRSATVVTVTVTGQAPSFVPGMATAIDVTVTGPVERWVN
ncbi:TadE/TadG family type IV pilus assembly protein [Micromonospora sp. DT81.3]|uniref:TadE/TadG family type IV pilus assembly protein n=1 Tax=Micromonospora sp. DT81.3 TaxID=3416523 RepID=UPI003CF52670